MRPFTYARPDDAEAAVATADADPGAVFLAGGTNLLDHLKLGVATPSSVVDLGRVTSTAITELDDGGDGDGAERSSTTRSGLRIGAGALNSDVAAHPLVRRRYPALAQALLEGFTLERIVQITAVLSGLVPYGLFFLIAVAYTAGAGRIA